MTRRAIVSAFVLAELWQFLFGALSSMQVGAPGVGDRASWVPSILEGEALTLLPLGFVGCLWGAPAGRMVGAACAVASLAVAVAAVVALSSPASSFIFYLLFLAPPGLVLLAVAWKGPAPVTSALGESSEVMR